MTQKFKVEIDGTDYINDIGNWRQFLPVDKRDETYHSHLKTFSANRLSLSAAAKAYVVAQKDLKGSFANSTFVISSFNYNTDVYDEIVAGTLDYKTASEDVISGTFEVLFFPDEPAQKIIKRDDQNADLQKLVDFDGNAITAFSGTHGETYTLSLTKTEIAGLTEVATSNCEVMLPWEIGLRLAQKILGRNDAFRSDLLGRTDGEVFQTDADGRLAFVSMTNGDLIRGDTLTDNPISMSLADFFEYLNAIEPISMGIEYINDVAFLRIEDIDYEYDSISDPIWTIENPESFQIVTNESRVYGRVLSGYRNFEKADDAGVGQSNSYIESMHTTRRYVTGLDAFSKNIYNVLSNGIASSYLNEIVRNNVIANNNNEERGNDIFYIVVKRDGVGGFEIDNDYVSVTGVDDPTTQKNYLLTPGRTILNHLKVINAALIREYKNREANEVGFAGFNPIRFVDGEGNKTASTKIGSEAAEIEEDADLSAGVEPIFLEDDLLIKTNVSEAQYKLIQDNKKKRVKVTYDDMTCYGYIDELRLDDLYQVDLVLRRANDDY